MSHKSPKLDGKTFSGMHRVFENGFYSLPCQARLEFSIPLQILGFARFLPERGAKLQ
jgi:hypothetical protein